MDVVHIHLPTRFRQVYDLFLRQGRSLPPFEVFTVEDITITLPVEDDDGIDSIPIGVPPPDEPEMLEERKLFTMHLIKSMKHLARIEQLDPDRFRRLFA